MYSACSPMAYSLVLLLPSMFKLTSVSTTQDSPLHSANISIQAPLIGRHITSLSSFPLLVSWRHFTPSHPERDRRTACIDGVAVQCSRL
ncbi:hypothetical protein BJ322DRAFT_404706 [Thelephora terrestris]|uniref:Secreted protein n=1 Tax=Thelephora terrestris TaxID=56493 RepID=A0A9P6HMP5_9AGAM|nr:hypothetical protein BJ322DRAFT_404706 [Thelephora terrestris]